MENSQFVELIKSNETEARQYMIDLQDDKAFSDLWIAGLSDPDAKAIMLASWKTDPGLISSLHRVFMKKTDVAASSLPTLE